MKKSLLALLAIPILVACGQNIEEKAGAFAENEVKKVLNDASSYESVETRVDSAFSTIYIDYDACVAATELSELKNKIESLKSEYANEKASAAIWSGPYQSTLGREQQRQAKDKMDKISEQIEKAQKQLTEKKQIIIERNNAIKSKEFIGWAITHRFRCANGMGIKGLHDILLVSDPKFETLIIRMILDKDDPQGFETIKEKIDEVLSGQN